MLQNLREAHITLTTTTVRAIAVAHFQHHAPQLFSTPVKDGSLFRFSEVFIRKLLKRSLNWGIRRATRAGGKIPENSDEILTKAFLRMAHCVKTERIPSRLIVNTDQTQNLLAQGNDITYAEIGSKQVAACGAEEKRAITIVVSLSNDGVVLPIQAIYKGSTAQSLPSPSSPHYKDSVNDGFLFTSSMTSTYWSTLATMKEFVNKILAPYYDRVVEELNLPEDQHRLWYIDSWSVHRSAEFLDWMARMHPLIIVLFVPARMTGLFQPCDVGFQRVLKHALKQASHEDVVNEVLEKFKKGDAPNEVRLETKVKTLRDRTPRWLWVAYTKLNKPEIVQKVCESDTTCRKDN
ncbi:hypothetical protein BDN72DRAFT_781457 [Pluteus cervinus]|uniref:Uncharacterized protein n=1 Tax=Pluteus cervinus TaxID=181527 RepID=A0ACD2ZZV6_9AGAR|nr:hypothetical protein BDN72DRAFT_781457 [Pluteus cervinus]